MLKIIARLATGRAARQRLRQQQERIEGWSLQVGREAAELWVQALSSRDTARLSNA